MYFATRSGAPPITIAGKNQGVAADAIARTIRPGHFETAHGAVAVGEERADGGVADDSDCSLLRRAMQPVNQFGAGTAGQAMHAACGMAGIIEVVHEAEWKTVTIGEPLHRCSGVLRDEFGYR